MAKPGGKAVGKRKDKRADQDKEKMRAKPGKAPKGGRPGNDKDEALRADGAKAKATKASASAAAVTSGSRATASKATGPKTPAPKLTKPKRPRPKGATQLLVEQIAEEIVTAEYDRAVNGAAAREAAAAQELAQTAAREAAAGGAGEQAADADEAIDGAFGELLRLPGGPVDLGAFDPGATPGVSSREKAEAQLPKLAAKLDELQERLFAAARGGDSNRRVLLVLQGMDTSGKGGTVRHVVGQLDPNGIRVTAFKAPTEEERAHDFLWRIRNALPKAGEVGIFDRSHYEDVLIARVHKLALPMVIGKRYQLINRFEQGLVADGTVVIKCFLRISPDEQRKRLLTRLDDPSKHWKYNPSDVDERALWPQYQEAYRLALEKCSTEDAPWYVIPADHKWYRNYAITRLLLEALERIDPAYPPGAFDIEVERKRLLAG